MSSTEAEVLAGPEELLAQILDVVVAATGFDLRKSPGLAQRANGNVDVVAASVETETLLEANGYRRGCSIVNDATESTLYVKLGPSASTEDWSITLGPGDYYEPPTGYRGELSGVWSEAEGQARVSEFN